MNCKTLLLILIIYVLIIQAYSERHPECGEPPTHRYKDLAKAIGNLLFKIIKILIICLCFNCKRMGLASTDKVYQNRNA